MTLDPDIRDFMRARLREAFSYKAPAQRPQVVCIDLMQWVKVLTENMRIFTLQDVVVYLVRKCLAFMPKETVTLIVCWDRSSPPVKKLVCHASRYKKIDVLAAEDGPHLPNDPLTPLASLGLDNENWLRFSASGDNLRRELGPRLVNAFMDTKLIKLAPYQSIILNGFPIKMKTVTVYDLPPDNLSVPVYGEFERRTVPVPWTIHADDDGFGDVPITPAMEEDDPQLYNRVVSIRPNGPQGAFWMQEEAAMTNAIAEADSSIFWFDHFFPNQDQMLVINDGDAILIGLLYARERMVGREFRNRQTLCLRYSKKKPGKDEDWGARTTPPDYEYVDLNQLFCSVEEDAEFTKAGVNNHALPYVFLAILPGNDFFADFCKGIGLKTIVATYLEMLPMFANLLQWNNAGMSPCARTIRRVVMDEALFEEFTLYLYAAKYQRLSFFCDTLKSPFGGS
jgi:hypothetical protein